MRSSWRRIAVYGLAVGLVSVGIRSYLRLRTETAKLRRLSTTDDIIIDNVIARGYFYFEDQQALVLAKTAPVLLKPADGYFRYSGVFVFLPPDITTDDIYEAFKDSAYYLETNVANRGIPAAANLVLKRDEWDSSPLPSPQIVAKLLAHYFRTNGITAD